MSIAKWHYWAGWITVLGFVFHRGIILLRGESPVVPLKPEHIIHAVLSIFCASFAIAKIRKITRSGIQQKFNWAVSFYVIGAVFVITTCTVIVLRIANLEIFPEQQKWSFFPIFLLVHIGTAVILIWFGYLLLSNEKKDIKLDSVIQLNAKG